MKASLRTYVATMLIVALSAPAFAARVTVEPQNAAVYVGQALTLQYRLTQTSVPADPPILRVDGCEVQYAGMGQSSTTHIVNNRRRTSNEFIYSYKVHPQESGVFNVPALVFEMSDGSRATAPETTIVTAEAPSSPDFHLQIEMDADEVYVGQPVNVKWVWLTAQRVSQAEITWPTPEGAQVFVAPRSKPDRNRGAAVTRLMGKEAALRSENRSSNDRAWTAYVAEMVIVPTRSGVLKLPDSSVLIEADTGRRRRGISVFDSRSITETVSAKASGPTLVVRELPEKGRPDDFSGLVGRYRLEAAASPTNVRVGDPIELTVVVYGPEAAAREPEIDFATMPGFGDLFRIDSTGDDIARVQGGTILKRTLRAQRDGVSSIPPIELPYFDPELGRYATARTAPIPLEVTPTRIVTLADAKGVGDSEPTGAEIQSRDGGLRANVTAQRALRSEGAGMLTILQAPENLALLGAPPVVFGIAGAAVVVRSRRSRGQDARSAKRALPGAVARLEQASSPDDISSAVREYIAIRFPEAGSAVTGEEVRRLLDDAGPTAHELAYVLETCDAARFGGVGTDCTTLAQRAGDALQALDRGEAR